MNFTTDQLMSEVDNLTVQDCVLGIKTVDRLSQQGVLGTELTPLGWFRERMKTAIREAIGVDYDLPESTGEKN